MIYVYHYYKPAGTDTMLIEFAGSFYDLDAARVRADALLASPLSDADARVELDRDGVTIATIKIVRKPADALMYDRDDAADFDVPARSEDD